MYYVVCGYEMYTAKMYIEVDTNIIHLYNMIYSYKKTIGAPIHFYVVFLQYFEIQYIYNVYNISL